MSSLPVDIISKALNRGSWLGYWPLSGSCQFIAYYLNLVTNALPCCVPPDSGPLYVASAVGIRALGSSCRAQTASNQDEVRCGNDPTAIDTRRARGSPWPYQSKCSKRRPGHNPCSAREVPRDPEGCVSWESLLRLRLSCTCGQGDLPARAPDITSVVVSLPSQDSSGMGIPATGHIWVAMDHDRSNHRNGGQ